MYEAALSLGFFTGLMGFAHCAGMCGSICAAFALRRPAGGTFLFLGLYQVGRIFTYSLLGWLGASLGAAFLGEYWLSPWARWVLVACDAMVILLGLSGLGLLPGLSFSLESPARFAAPVAGLARRLSAAPGGLAPLLTGALFGLIPCGFLYPMLITASISADPKEGAATMLAFGLGTSPALLLVGGAAAHARRLYAALMPIAWLIVVAMGSYNLYRHLTMLRNCHI